jgi:hypothetical protein
MSEILDEETVRDSLALHRGVEGAGRATNALLDYCIALGESHEGLRDRVRVLTEALREIHDLSLLPFSDNDRREIGVMARSLLASVPSEPTVCPTCGSNDPALELRPCSSPTWTPDVFHSVPSEETTP